MRSSITPQEDGRISRNVCEIGVAHILNIRYIEVLIMATLAGILRPCGRVIFYKGVLETGGLPLLKVWLYKNEVNASSSMRGCNPRTGRMCNNKEVIATRKARGIIAPATEAMLCSVESAPWSMVVDIKREF